MINITTIEDVFAKSIFTKSIAINSLTLDKRQRARIMESISDDIRKYTDLIKPMVSINAKKQANKIGIILEENGWHDQKKFDLHRKYFQLDHVILVKDVRESCLKSKDEEEIKNILINKTKVAWILYEENKKLSELGYRSNRPDPAAAYKEAGIKLEK
jgi:hypothetical protein